ncbi:MAG: hypothetical protein ACREFH_15750, partial [Stellaceae bacterium]
WGDFVIIKYKIRYHLGDTNNLRDWADLQFLAKRTASVSNLVYFPFVAWAVLVFSRSRLFDDFYMSWSMMVLYALPLCVLTGFVVAYRLTAEKARSVACRHVANRIIAAKGKSDGRAAEQLERLLADMRELSEGAFAGWASQPIVRAVLLPLLTYGGGWLLHLYALPGA